MDNDKLAVAGSERGYFTHVHRRELRYNGVTLTFRGHTFDRLGVNIHATSLGGVFDYQFEDQDFRRRPVRGPR